MAFCTTPLYFASSTSVASAVCAAARTLDRVDWNAELVRGDLQLVRGDLRSAVEQLKREAGKGLLLGGMKLPLASAGLGLIDEYEFVVQPRLAGHGPTLFAGLSKHIDLRLMSRLELGSGRWRCGMSLERSHRACWPESAAWAPKTLIRARPSWPISRRRLKFLLSGARPDRVCCWRIPEVAPALTDFPQLLRARL